MVWRTFLLSYNRIEESFILSNLTTDKETDIVRDCWIVLQGLFKCHTHMHAETNWNKIETQMER